MEGLRAAAALAVLYAHLTSPLAKVDPTYVPSAWWWRVEVALPAVMVFFLISGYVIGLTNAGPCTPAAIGQYLWRRAVRLLPIYFVAVALGWLALPGPARADLIGNFLLLQNNVADNPFHVRLLLGNSNLWSLHYEVAYYLAFLLLWWWRPRLGPVMLLLALAGLMGAWFPGFSLWAAWIASGGVLWVLGLAVAWHLPVDPGFDRSPWPSALLLGLASWKLQIFTSVLARLGHPITWVPGITFDYLDGLPVWCWLFLLLTRRRPRWLVLVEGAAWLLPAGYLAWRLRHGLPLWQEPLAFSLAVFFLALLLRGWKPSLAPWHRLAPVGAISYGLYALGSPVQHFVNTHWLSWHGTPWSYGLRSVLILALTFPLAWLLERWLQPRLRRWLRRAPRSGAAPVVPHPAT